MQFYFKSLFSLSSSYSHPDIKIRTGINKHNLIVLKYMLKILPVFVGNLLF